MQYMIWIALENAKRGSNDTKMFMHPAIKLRHIRAFLDIAQQGNLSAVARVMGVSQPALSRSLAELEDLLGQPLFQREGRRLVLTEAGITFRHHASLGLQSLETAAAALRADARQGRLNVGVLPTASTRLFPQVMLKMRALLPDVLLSVTTGPHPYLMGLLRQGQIDLMVGRMPAAAEMAGLMFEHLYEEEVTLTLRAGHPMQDAPLRDILLSCPLILPPPDAVIRRVVEDYLLSLGLPNLRAAFETVAPALGRELVLASDAIWFISRGVVRDDLDAGRMIALPTDVQFMSGAVGFTRQQAKEAPHLASLQTILRDCVTQSLHS